MRDSMIFYRSFAEAIECLDEEDQLAAFWDIVNYALDGQEPDGSGAAMAVFKMAKPQIDTNAKRYENGTRGGRPKPNNNQTITKQEPNHNQTITKPEPNVNVNVNDNVNDKREREKRERFSPPTVEQVKEYAAEKGYAIDAERFVDFYSSKGWMVGKNKMKDWKSAVRNWCRPDSSRQEKATKAKKTDFEHRDYDYADLNKRLFGGARDG